MDQGMSKLINVPTTVVRIGSTFEYINGRARA